MRITDLDKISYVKLGYGGLVLSSRQFSMLTQQPQKMTHASKVVNSDSKIIITVCWSKSVTHSVDQWFSTFFRSRNTKHEKKFYGTLIPEFFFEKDLGKELYFTNCKQNFLIFLKRVVKVRSKKKWRYTWKELTAHRLRNTAVDNKIFSV